MSKNQINWEGLLLAFAMIFTVLIGVSYVFANIFHIAIPWLGALLGALAITVVLGLTRRSKA